MEYAKTYIIILIETDKSMYIIMYRGIYKLYTRKQGTYFVNKVFPEWGIDTLRTDLMERARKMTREEEIIIPGCR